MNSYALRTQKDVISFINSNEEYRKIYRPLKQKIAIGRILKKIPFYVMIVVVAVGALVSERLISNYTPNTNFLIMIITALIPILIIAIFCGFLLEVCMGVIADNLFEKVIKDSNFIYLNSILEEHGYMEEYPVKKMVENTIKVKWFWRFGSEMKLEKVKEVK